jgi:hypothetical protein
VVLRDLILAPTFRRSFCESPDPWDALVDRHGPVLVDRLVPDAFVPVSRAALQDEVWSILKDDRFSHLRSEAQQLPVWAWFDAVRDGDDFLPAGEAAASMDVVAQPQGQELAPLGERAQAGERLGRMGRSGLDESPLESRAPGVGVAHQRDIDLAALLDCGLRNAFGPAVTVRLVGQLLADRGEVIWARRVLDLGQPRGPLAWEMPAPPEPSPARPHRGGVHVGLGQHAAAPPHGHLLGLARIVLGLAPGDGLQGERRAEDARTACTGAAIGPPGPGAETFDPANPGLTRGGNRLEKRFRPCLPVPVEQARSRLVQDAESQGAGMPVAPTRKLVWRSVESPEVSAS